MRLLGPPLRRSGSQRTALFSATEREADKQKQSDIEAENQKKLDEWENRRSGTGDQASVTNVNLNMDGNGNVTPEGMPTQVALQNGQAGLKALEERLYGAIGELEGGTAALNKHALS